MVIFEYLMETTFGYWLQEELKARGISQADLARLSGITPAQISRLINESRGIGPEASNAIAKALNIPPETVFRAASWLPPSKDKTALVERIEHLIANLPEEDQKDVEAYVELRHRIAAERGKYESKEKKSKSSGS